MWEWVVDDEAVSVGKTANCIQPLLQVGLLLLGWAGVGVWGTHRRKEMPPITIL